MARKKISKKDLQKRAARLEKKVATTTRRLKQQQSDVARTLSSVRQQVKKLRKGRGADSRLESLGERQQEFSLANEGVVAKLHDLEDSASLLERAAEELQARINALEGTAAEIGNWQQKITELTSRLDERSAALPSVQDGLNRLTANLNELWAKTDSMGVELSQQAHVTTQLGQSRDELAEQTGSLQADLRALSEQQTELDQQTSKLGLVSADAARMKESHDALSGQYQELTQTTADNAARLHELEQAATRAQRAADDLRRRTDALESSVADAAGQREELLQRAVELEGRTDALLHLQDQQQDLQPDRRFSPISGVAPYDGFAPDGEQAGERTQAIEGQLARLSEAQEVLELQVALLSREAEGSVTLPREGDDILADHDARPAQGTNGLAERLQDVQDSVAQQMQNGADLSARSQRLETSATELLQAQQTLQDRVDQLDRQIAELRQGISSDDVKELAGQIPKLLAQCSLTEEAAGKLSRRTAVLEAGNKSLTQHDEQFATRLQSLEQSLNRIRKHIGALRQADEALDQRLHSTVVTAKSLEERVDALRADNDQLQAHTARLAQQQHLEEVAAKHNEALDSLDDRLAKLADEQRALQGTTASLGVLQARQNGDAQNLQQTLKKRSLLGLLMLLLTAAVLGFLLFRAPIVPEQLRQTIHADEAAREKTAAAIVNIESKMSKWRQDLSVLDSSVKQVSHTVEEIGATEAPQLPARIGQLEAVIDTLNKTNLQRQQEIARLLADQGQLRAEVDRIAAEVKALDDRLAQPPTASSSPTPPDQSWAQAQKMGRYTLQLAGFFKRESLAWFLSHQHIDGDTAVYHTENQGRRWYVVFHGIYDTIDQALAAVKELPSSLAKNRPWVRTIPHTGNLYPR